MAERHQLAGPQAHAVEHFKHGPVSPHQRAVPHRGCQELLNLIASQCTRQAGRRAGHVEGTGWIGRGQILGHQEPVEAAQADRCAGCSGSRPPEVVA